MDGRYTHSGSPVSGTIGYDDTRQVIALEVIATRRICILGSTFSTRETKRALLYNSSLKSITYNKSSNDNSSNNRYTDKIRWRPLLI